MRYFKIANYMIHTKTPRQELEREEIIEYLEPFADKEIVAEYERQEKEIDPFWYDVETNQLIEEWLTEALTTVYKDEFGVYVDGGKTIGHYTIYAVSDDNVDINDLPRMYS